MYQPFVTGLDYRLGSAPADSTSGARQARLSRQAADRYAVLYALAAARTQRKARRDTRPGR